MFLSFIKKQIKHFPPVFVVSGVFVLFLLILAAISPDGFVRKVEYVNKISFIYFGNYYLWFITLSLIVFILIGLSPLGRIRIGGPSVEPEYSFFSWFSMLFCAGMGVGLMFWGPAEPLFHFLNPPVQGMDSNFQKEITALQFSFFHWGLHPWGIYGLTALAVSFFGLNLKRGFYFSSFLIKDGADSINIKRVIKALIDILTVLAILFGVVASFGMGVIQLEGGLQNVFNLKHSIALQLGIILFFLICYMISALKGLNNGIRVLSNYSMILSFILLICLIWFIPKSQIFELLTHSIPAYLGGLPNLSLGYLNFRDVDFLRDWTIKYWSWWIAWAPFVGIFVALISKGRTVRELMIFILIAPTVFSCLWFLAFGEAAISLQISQKFVGSALEFKHTNLVLFNMLDGFTQIPFLSWVSIILIAIFFINSADSATYTLASLVRKKQKNIKETSKELENPPRALQFGWGFLFAILAALFLLTGGIKILQQITLITVFPFSVLLCIVFIKLVIEMIKYPK